MGEADEVLEQATDWLGSGKNVALATVIGTWGSSPRPVGSQLAVDGDGAFVGSVSGGCIEGAVVGEALQSIEDGKPRTLEFGVTNEQAWEVGLACGGDIKVLVEKEADQEMLERLISDRPVATVTDIETGERSLVRPDGVDGGLALPDGVVSQVREALRSDVSRVIEDGGRTLFVRVFNTPLRMVCVGAVHIAQSLAPMAALAGFDVTVVDPRGSFATADRFPEVSLNDDWPDDAMDEIKPDGRTAVVTLTHDPKLDDPALDRALKSDAFYIGALGSKRTHASRVERLKEAGFTDGDISRIHAPIGLDIGSKSPSEIAVSILSEIVAAKHGKTGV